jgi:hypothetical protein
MFIVAGCGGSESGQGLSKDEARQIGKADWTTDHCAENGWYGDDNCDDFCPLRDPDCPNSTCQTDEGCQYGSTWCEDGTCQPCDNSGLFCDLACPFGFEERNGCTPCRCARSNGCLSDADCQYGEQWCVDGECSACDNSGLYCDMYCEFGYVERNGCTPCQCAEPENTCETDGDCEYGAEWCTDGECTECDNSGLRCYLYCRNGFLERNGCTPCICAP